MQQLQEQIYAKFNLGLEDLPFEFRETAQGVELTAAFPCAWLAAISPSQFHWQQQIPSVQTQLPGYRLKNISNAIAIISGKGGVGKSTISSNLAVASARLGASVGLLDADIYGPSIPTMMGLKGPIESAALPVIQHGVACMSMGLLQEDGPLVWRGPMLAKALIEMINQTAWPQLDYLFIDMPPGTGDISLSLAQKIPLAGAVIVTTPQTIATLDAKKALQMCLKLNIPVLGIIANMAWHECENCGHETHIFGNNGAKALAEEFSIPLIAEIPLNTSTRHFGDLGQPIASFTDKHAEHWQKIAFDLSLLLAKRPAHAHPKIPPLRVEG